MNAFEQKNWKMKFELNLNYLNFTLFL